MSYSKTTYFSLCVKGNFDYVAVDRNASFDKPDGLSQCVNISIISDGLTENNESFSVHILNGTRSLLKATVIIRASVDAL